MSGWAHACHTYFCAPLLNGNTAGRTQLSVCVMGVYGEKQARSRKAASRKAPGVGGRGLVPQVTVVSPRLLLEFALYKS